VDGSDFPQIYEWLSDALLRQRRFAEARGVLEEAVSKWPGDNRFAKPLALVYATFGQGPMAVRLMERHLDDHPDETEALQLAVEWLYHLKRAGTVARSPAQDASLARRYADAYTKTKGSQQALVRQWMQFIEAK
jgi:predicted Zn-dependent protease